MKKRKPLTQTVFEWFVCISGGIIGLGFSSLVYDSKIVGSFLVSTHDFVEPIIGLNVTNVLFSCSFFGLGFLLGWIIVWCLNQIDRKLGGPMTSKKNE